MKESYGEGLASHTGPNSYTTAREGEGEAWRRGRAGWVLSREMHAPGMLPGFLQGADAVGGSGRPYLGGRQREIVRALARSETPGMYGYTLHGNREDSCLSNE